MQSFIRLFCNHNKNITAIACCWVLGLISGAAFSINSASCLYSLTRSLRYSDLSVVGFLAMLIFPYLLSTVIFKLSMWKGIIPLVFFKAFSFSCCAVAIIRAFGSSGWLLRLLLLFSGSISVVFLIWFWIRNCSKSRRNLHGDLLLCIVLTLVAGFIDYSLISPFGIYLLSNL